MPRLGLGLGLNRPSPFYIGGIPQPPFPSGFSEYWNGYDSALVNTVTGVSIDAWTGTSVVPQILAQATSANQPSFIENDVATQSLVSSQPTLIDTGGGVLAVEFDDNNNLPLKEGTVETLSSDWSILLEFETLSTSYLMSRDASSALVFILSLNQNVFRVYDSLGSITSFSGPSFSGFNELLFVANGNTLKAFLNGTQFGVDRDITGLNFDVSALGRTAILDTVKIKKYQQWDLAVADPTNITETPDFELLPTIETIPSGIGNPLSKWYATSYNRFQNRIRKANDEYMDDYPIQTGDQSHVIRSDYDMASGVTNYPVSSASFDGLGSWYYRLTNDVFRGSTGLSMVAYIYLDALTGTRTVFAEASAPSTIRINFGANGDKLRFNTRTANAGYLTYTGTETLTVGWNTIGVTQSFSGSGAEGVTLYTNGVSEFFATGGITGIETSFTGMPTSIGTWNYNTSGAHAQNFKGDISFVRISNTDVWDASEVAEALTTPAKDTGSISAPMTFAMDCATYTGSAGAFVDQIGSNDAVEIGTASYIDNALTIDVEASGALMKDLSHSTLPSYVGVNASNQFVLTSDSGTVFTFATTTADTENRAKVWVVRGNDLEFWLDAVLVETKDFTGETLTLDQFGAPSDSSTGDTEYIVPFTDAISQSDIEYFNYQRLDSTNEIILVDGLPIIVS